MVSRSGARRRRQTREIQKVTVFFSGTLADGGQTKHRSEAQALNHDVIIQGASLKRNADTGEVTVTTPTGHSSTYEDTAEVN